MLGDWMPFPIYLVVNISGFALVMGIIIAYMIMLPVQFEVVKALCLRSPRPLISVLTGISLSTWAAGVISLSYSRQLPILWVSIALIACMDFINIRSRLRASHDLDIKIMLRTSRLVFFARSVVLVFNIICITISLYPLGNSS